MATTFKATDIADYKIEAERSLHPHAWVYYSTASGGMETYQDNRRVFERLVFDIYSSLTGILEYISIEKSC